MANRPGMPQPPQRFRKGTVLAAEDLNRIVAALIRRMEGGKGIMIRTFNGQIIIEASDT